VSRKSHVVSLLQVHVGHRLCVHHIGDVDPRQQRGPAPPRSRKPQRFRGHEGKYHERCQSIVSEFTLSESFTSALSSHACLDHESTQRRFIRSSSLLQRVELALLHQKTCKWKPPKPGQRPGACWSCHTPTNRREDTTGRGLEAIEQSREHHTNSSSRPTSSAPPPKLSPPLRRFRDHDNPFFAPAAAAASKPQAS